MSYKTTQTYVLLAEYEYGTLQPCGNNHIQWQNCSVLPNTHWQHFIEKNPLIMLGGLHLPGVYSSQLRMNVDKKKSSYETKRNTVL
jgi:hypothetical protein